MATAYKERPGVAQDDARNNEAKGQQERLRLDSPVVAGLIVNLSKPINAARSFGFREEEITSMIYAAAEAYDRHFSSLNIDESLGLLERINRGILDCDSVANDGSSSRITRIFTEFDKDAKPSRINSKPSMRTLGMLASMHDYAKGINFSVSDGIVSIASDNAESLHAHMLGEFPPSSKFGLSRQDCYLIVKLSRLMQIYPSITTELYINAVTDAAMFFNEFVQAYGKDAGKFLEYALGIPYIKDVLGLGKDESLESIVFAMTIAKQYESRYSNVQASRAFLNGITMKRQDIRYLHVFTEALNIMARGDDRKNVFIAVSDSGKFYSRAGIYYSMNAFINRTKYLRAIHGPLYSIAEDAAKSCLKVILSDPSKQSIDEIWKMFDTARKGLFFNLISSISNEVKNEADASTLKIIEILKGSKSYAADAFMLVVKAVSLIYGVNIYVEKIGKMVALSKMDIKPRQG